MSAKNLLLVGAGGHAKSCVDIVQQDSRFKIAGLIGLPEEIGNYILDCKIIGSDADLKALAIEYQYALVTVGQIKDSKPRIRIFKMLEDIGYELPTVVSPHAYVSPHAKLGAGTIVMHGAIINAGSSVGRNCIINSGSLVEHDTKIEDHCHISTAATINGGVKVGEGSFVGSAACVLQGVTIGDNCVIGMGQTIYTDCSSGSWLSNNRKSV